MDAVLASRMRASLFSIFFADALSMPVHWYFFWSPSSACSFFSSGSTTWMVLLPLSLFLWRHFNLRNWSSVRSYYLLPTCWGRSSELHHESAFHRWEQRSVTFLNLPGGGGRGAQQASIVGDVILKGKKHLWGQRGMHVSFFSAFFPLKMFFLFDSITMECKLAKTRWMPCVRDWSFEASSLMEESMMAGTSS